MGFGVWGWGLGFIGFIGFTGFVGFIGLLGFRVSFLKDSLHVRVVGALTMISGHEWGAEGCRPKVISKRFSKPRKLQKLK